MKYFISIGSNEGPSEEIMGAALHKLSLMPFLSISKVSSLYKTPPWGKTDQAEFLNAVIEADWQGTPEELMRLLLDTENSFGRKRMMRWGSRTLDLDLLYGENVEKQTEFLKLPHPFFWERLFVLVPFAEIMPYFIFKGQDIQSRIRELGGGREIVKQEITGKGAYPWQTK